MLDVENLSVSRMKVLSYTAGVVDSDGSITISKRANRSEKGEYTLVVAVANTNPRMGFFLKENFGGGLCIREIRKREDRNTHKPQLHWSIASKNAEIFLEELHPYLVCKKEEAIVALQFRATYSEEYMLLHRSHLDDGRYTTQAIRDARDKLYNKLKDLHAKKF